MEYSINICFLITENIYNKQLWKVWFEEANQNNIKINKYAHISRGIDECMKWAIDNNINLVDEINTKWASPELVLAEYNLFNKSFENNNQSFSILVSQDTIPLVSALELYNELIKNKLSIIDNADKYMWDNSYVNPNLSKYNITIASQFVILTNEAWNIIKHLWNKHFDEFSKVYTTNYGSYNHYCIDEIFIQSLFSMYNIPYISRYNIYAEYDDIGHAIIFDDKKIEEIKKDNKYLFIRKIRK